jgi:hypothetical protein
MVRIDGVEPSEARARQHIRNIQLRREEEDGTPEIRKKQA